MEPFAVGAMLWNPKDGLPEEGHRILLPPNHCGCAADDTTKPPPPERLPKKPASWHAKKQEAILPICPVSWLTVRKMVQPKQNYFWLRVIVRAAQQNRGGIVPIRQFCPCVARF